MTITCDTVRRAFGEFQCCDRCHANCGVGFLCCESAYVLSKNKALFDPSAEPPTHPALLRAIEEQNDRR